jgi:murein DD-endopeptidase MepM/ murein hydrolase activator NlpD
MHPIRKKLLGHDGVDLAASSSSVVSAAARGTVAKIGWDPDGYGRYVVIKHANGYYSLYAHLLKNGVNVKKNQKVSNGQVIASSGNTGGSTGPHLHFEIIRAKSLAGVFNKKNKIDPESINDLDVLLHGETIPFTFNRRLRELMTQAFDVGTKEMDPNYNDEPEPDPRPEASTITPVPIVPPKPLPLPDGGIKPLPIPVPPKPEPNCFPCFKPKPID